MALKARALLKIPSRIVGGGSVEVTLSGGVYTISAVGVSDGDKGDITVSSNGAAWAIDDNAVTFAKMQNLSSNKLLGAVTAGDPVEISLGTGLSFTGTTLNSVAGGAPGGAGTELQFRDTTNFGGAAGTSWDDTNRALTIAGATVTTSKPIFDLSQTWNAGGTTFTALKLDVTNTAAANGSNLLDLKIGGATMFQVVYGGTGGDAFAQNSVSAGNVYGGGGALYARMGSLAADVGVGVNSASIIGWSSGTSAYTGHDVILRRDAAGILSQRDGANPQAERLYNTWTDVNNWERLGITWSSNICTIEAEALGTGTARVVAFKGRHVSPMRSELTIAGGSITVTSTYHNVDTEADAGTDDLDTINGGVDGAILILRANNDARTVVVKDGTGNLQLAGDHSLDNTQDTIILIFDSTLSAWLELSRSDNGA